MNKIINLTKLPFILFLFIFAIGIVNTSFVYGESLEKNESQFFLCGIYFNTPHCDFANNKIESYQTKGIFQKIYSNDLTYVARGDEKALQLSKPGEHITIPSYSSLVLENSMTMNLLVNFSDSPIDERIIFIKANFFKLSTNLESEQATISAHLYTKDGISKITIPLLDEDLKKWVMLTVTFDVQSNIENFKIYKNSILIETKKVSGEIQYNKFWNQIGSLSTGGRSIGANNIFQIDNLSIWDRSLAQIEIDELFAQNFKNKQLSKSILNSMLGYWTFEDNIKDVSGNHNNAHFSQTVISSMVFDPEGRLFFTEKESGLIKIIKDDLVLESPFFHIKDIHSAQEMGLLGIVLDPKFEENHFVYVFYTYKDEDVNEIFAKIVRFTEVNNIGTKITTIYDKITAKGGAHVGGAMAFGPDEKLYVTVGDGGQAESAQDVSTLFGKILRINNDGTIPSDNPFANSPVFTLGHRNMFGIAFNDSKNIGIVTENGDQHYDEINKITKAGNYGWPNIQPPNVPPEISTDSIKPLRSYWQVTVPAQAIFYDGNKYPELNDRFVFTALAKQAIIGLQFNDDYTKIIREDTIKLVDKGLLVSLAQSPNGIIYFGTDKIYKLESLDTTTKQIEFPVEIISLSKIKEFQVNSSEKKLIVNFDQINNSSVIIKIPKSVLDGKIFITDGEKELDFTIDRVTNDQNNILIPVVNSSHIEIYGTTVIPEFSNLQNIVFLSLVFFSVLILLIKKLPIKNILYRF